MVSLSIFVFTGVFAPACLGQVVINCGQNLSIGKNAQCANNLKFTINPDGSTNLSSGCLVSTTPPLPGQCVIKTGGILPTKNVRVDFDKTSVNMKNGAKVVQLNKFRMQYTSTVPAASKFTFTPTAVANTITIDIGATVSSSGSVGLGSYTGTVSVRANPI